MVSRYHQAIPSLGSPRSKSVACCGAVTCHRNWAFRVVMSNDVIWCHDVIVENLSHVITALWTVEHISESKPWRAVYCHYFTTCVLFLKSWQWHSHLSHRRCVRHLDFSWRIARICNNLAGLTEDVALALGIIVGSLGAQWCTNCEEERKSTSQTAGKLGPGHTGRMLNLANQCGNLAEQPSTTSGKLGYLFYYFYSICLFYHIILLLPERMTTPNSTFIVPMGKKLSSPKGTQQNQRKAEGRNSEPSGRQLPSAGSPQGSWTGHRWSPVFTVVTGWGYLQSSMSKDAFFPWNRRNKPTITWGTPMAEIPICQIHPDPSRSIQIHPDPSRSIQICWMLQWVMRAQWMTDPVAWVELSWRLSTLSFTQESVPVDEHMHVFSHRGPQDLWRSSKAMVEGVPWCTQKLRASTFGRGQCMSVLSVVVMHARPWIVWEEHASESAKECPTCEKVYNESNFTTYSIAKKSGTKLTPIKHSADNRNDSGMTGNWDSRALVCSSRILRYIA